MEVSTTDIYWQYLHCLCPNLSLEAMTRIEQTLTQTQWDDARSALDCNNNAVIALIAAEQCESSELRQMYLMLALEALNLGANQHPLCRIHLALLHSLIGADQDAIQIAFSTFIELLQPPIADSITPGLVYLPEVWRDRWEPEFAALQECLEAQTGRQQCQRLLAEVLARSHPVFYNATGLRCLQIANQLAPQSSAINLRLGIAHFSAGQWEGLFWLQQAQSVQPQNVSILQALQLAYRELGWQSEARSQQDLTVSEEWTQFATDSSLTTVPFEDLRLVVEPSFRSIVTSVLLAIGDWFEREMEFWRDRLQPGMTVIDVGANVGVYTFSAARRVGASGCVVAIEPFSGCVRCLEETRRLNQLPWVRVCRGAASDRTGSVQLALHSASELNTVLTSETLETDELIDPAKIEEVPCFTLDELMQQEKLDRVDVIKIDAEGHELAVLAGSQQILTQFAPIVLYENIAGATAANLPVAEFLMQQGYQLFQYQPYLKQLLLIDSLEKLQNQLNIIAIAANQSK
jgi:FkbM family methyltransferase